MRSRTFLKYFILLVVAGNLGLAAVVFLGGSQPPKTPPLPNPNGYDDFVRAIRLLNASYPPNRNLTNEVEAQLRDTVRANAESLKALRVGLGRESRVPLDVTTHDDTKLLSELSDMKKLAVLLDLEGQLAEMEHRTNDAARIYLEIVRFGLESSRGGLVIHALVDFAVQGIGIAGLRRVTDGLDPTASRQLISALVAIDQKQETVAEIMAGEKKFQHLRHGFRLRKMISDMIDSRSLDPQQKVRLALEGKTATLQRQTRLVTIKLAAHAYELEQGTPPKSFADLVPAYLKAIPIDPDTKTNFVYTPGRE